MIVFAEITISMKTNYSIVLLLICLVFLACQQSSSSNNKADDTSTVYKPSDDTSTSGQSDSAVDKGMGDTAGIQGGSKVNIGTDTAGHH